MDSPDKPLNARTWRGWLPWLAIVLLLGWPVHSGLATIGMARLQWQGWLATLGVAGLLFAASRWSRRPRIAWLLLAVPVVLALLFLRMLFFGLVRFSGHDFGADFFLHLEPESARVAWQQYRYLFVLLALGAVAVAVLLVVAVRRVRPLPRWRVATLAAASALFVVVGHQGMPAWRLWQAAEHWYAPKQLAVDDARLALWRKSPLLDVDLVTKQQLWAKPASPPDNLIFLYIEAGGVAMAPAARYPGLVPDLKRLIAEHGLVPHIHASSYVTMEGIVNTQCGTLYPFDGDSESMAGFDTMLEQMPCLGDVLHAAGYRQTFLGGADKRFAGKGRFLTVHGFDKVMGQGDWAAQGLNQRPGTWGVSDVDLFQQALLELQRLKDSGQPWNLTLLTIGTHLPGFPYEECRPWNDGSEVFLNAVSCTDQLVGQWIRQLRDGGWLDEHTWLVITGDHQVFPSVEMKRLFGDEAVADRRLPLIVLGGRPTPKAVQRDGAGYDIAPTVLDLLGVTTNARFALGRSLLREQARGDYIPSRFVDMLGESDYVAPVVADCAPGGHGRVPGAQPLSQCERDELFAILHAQAEAYSAPPSRMNCNSAVPLGFMLPAAADQPIRLDISARDESARFTWQSRHVDPVEPGLFLLALDDSGRVLSREYFPPDQIAGKLAQRPDPGEASLWLLAWRPGEKPEPLPAWLQQLGIHAAGIWLYAIHGDEPPRLLQTKPAGETLEIGRQQCEAQLRHDRP